MKNYIVASKSELEKVLTVIESFDTIEFSDHKIGGSVDPRFGELIDPRVGELIDARSESIKFHEVSDSMTRLKSDLTYIVCRDGRLFIIPRFISL